MQVICNNCNFEGDIIQGNQHSISKNHIIVVNNPANRFIKKTYGNFEYFNSINKQKPKKLDLDISNNTENSVNALIRELVEMYRDEVVAPLQRRDEVLSVIADINAKLPQVTEKMIRTTRSKIAALIRLEVVKDNPYGVGTDTINSLVQQFMSRSKISESFTNLQSNIINNIVEIYDTRWIDDLPRLIRDIATKEFESIRRIVVSETVTALNWGREQKYKFLEEKSPLEYVYRWNVHHDNRTTDECKEIEDRVNVLDGAVDLETLKQIVREVGEKYNPNLDLRDWQPHINCRSVLERVVLRKGMVIQGHSQE